MDVEEVSATAIRKYDGVNFYFCSLSCAQEFEANPARYAAQTEPEVSDKSDLNAERVHLRSVHHVVQPSEADHRVVEAYFCPMCSGVESEKPGDCPKCGMRLEPAHHESAGHTTYICPMHPEVEQDHPGDCPVCGMRLEPRIVAAFDKNLEDHESKSLAIKFWVGLLLTFPVFLLALERMLTGVHVDALVPASISKWVQLFLATVIVFWCGGIFFVRAWRSILSGNLNMFTLIGVGVGAAYLYSTVATILPQLFPESFKHDGEIDLYFEAAAVITVLVLLGQWLEAEARNRTGKAIRSLLGLAAKTAHRIDNAEIEEEVLVERLKPEDVVRVRPGEKVPLDGVIIEGSAAIDESMITGEAMPIEKVAGDKVIGATINQSGSFLMRVETVGSDTVLSQIVQMVGEAQRSRAPVQKQADRVSGYFVPGVIVFAVLTAIIWAIWGPPPSLAFALVNAVAVLIIACPCALGLATPMSIMVGVGRGAQDGILVKNAEAIEVAEKITYLVIDKTGTLTAGKPEVTDLIPFAGFNQVDVISLAAAVGAQSEHPLSRALVSAAQKRGLAGREINDFSSVTGGGVAAKVGANRVLVGKQSFLQDNGVPISSEMIDRADQLSAQARSLVWVACDRQAIGLIGLADLIKPTTLAAIQRLHGMGLKIMMATGDNPQTAAAIARKLPIDEVRASLLPDDKQRLIMELKEKGFRVAMAGDGINDAPALAAADLGIAMGTGTDVAIQSAGMTLVKGDLNGVAKALRLSKGTMQNIRQNLFFAFAYNLIGIPIAAGILYPSFGILLNPMIAGAAMALSSVSVISNSLRLNHLKL